jgi:hypothetical protein
MLEGFISKVKGFIMDPVGTFKASRDDPFGQVFIYFLVLLVIDSVLSAVVMAAGFNALMLPGMPATPVPSPAVVLIAGIVGGIIGAFIGSLWLHLWVFVLGGRKGLEKTVKSVFYASTPALLLGWIPFISLIGAIWSIILEIIGIRELHEISTGRAIAALVIAVVIPVIIFILLLGFFMISVVSSGMVPV